MAEKTWTQLQDEIDETFRKRRMDAPTISCALPKRSTAKRFQSEAERTVSISWREWAGGHSRPISLTVKRGERAIDNLALIAKAVEWIRMAKVREITDLVVLLYRQTHPQPPVVEVKTERAQSASGAPSGPYAVLHVANDAPLEVCEAAYKALVRKHHPDLGGDTATMQRLNAAIDIIRKKHA